VLPPSEPIGGLECITRARESDPGLAILALSAVDDARWRHAVLAAGAVVFVAKSAPLESITSAIADALEWATCGDEPLSSRLTPREREILALVADDKTNAEAARVLWLSPETVKFHLANVYRKLRVSSRSEAACWARRHGLCELRPDPEQPQGSPASSFSRWTPATRAYARVGRTHPDRIAARTRQQADRRNSRSRALRP
jgi:DNA-binding CsgD family transcriptional regulator